MQVGNQSRAVTSCVLPASSFFSHRLMLSRKQLELRTNSLCIGWSVKRRLRNIHIELLFFFVLHSTPLVCTPLHLSRHSLPCNKSLYTLKYIKPTVLCNINTIAFIICIHIEIKTNASCLCWVVGALRRPALRPPPVSIEGEALFLLSTRGWNWN